MKEKGFSLIELLVAILLLAIAALSLMALFPQGYREITKAGRMSVMNHLALQKIDELRALGYGALIDGTYGSSGQYRLSDPSDPDVDGYSLKWTVATDVSGVKTVVVEVGFLLYETDNSPILPNEQQFQLKETFVTYLTP